jgi:hypothetical protein
MLGSRMVAGSQVYSLYSLSALNYIIYILQEDGQNLPVHESMLSS